jgi:putative SOS response-associated peptidase YedK
MGNVRPRYNAAPSQELLVIRENHKTGERSLDLIRWGLIPHWCDDPSGGRKPINAKAESVATLPTFRDAYARRRCIVPVDGFFEWRAMKGARAKQPYAIAMNNGSPFGLAGLWENWRNPKTGEWERTFAIITVPSNELVGQNPRPHASDPRPCWLRPLARPRTRSARFARHLSVGADDDVANLHAGEQAGERRSLSD